MSVFSTGPGAGIFTKALTDVLGIGASIDSQGRFLSRLGPAIRRVLANPNGSVADFGGSLAMDPQNGTLYINKGVGNAASTTWVDIGVTAGGQAVMGQFFSSVDQTISNGTGISLMYFENTAISNGVTAVDPGTGFRTQLTVAAAGKYAFNISPQLLKTAGGGSGLVTFWLRKNGVDVPDSASFVDITNNEHMLPFVEIILDMAAGQYVEWAVNSTVANCRLEHEVESFAPAVVRPAGPSIIAGVKRLGS